MLASAASMPVGSFGHAYGQFMGRRHFRADERPPVRFVDDVQLAYVAQRAREVHDLWHVLFSCPTTVVGELALKALEFVQVPPCTCHAHCGNLLLIWVSASAHKHLRCAGFPRGTARLHNDGTAELLCHVARCCWQ